MFNVKNKKSEVKQVGEVETVHCPQRNVQHVFAFWTVKCTVLSALETKLKIEVCVQYRCTFFVQ